LTPHLQLSTINCWAPQIVLSNKFLKAEILQFFMVLWRLFFLFMNLNFWKYCTFLYFEGEKNLEQNFICFKTQTCYAKPFFYFKWELPPIYSKLYIFTVLQMNKKWKTYYTLRMFNTEHCECRPKNITQKPKPVQFWYLNHILPRYKANFGIFLSPFFLATGRK
jgi:hypothetical protein